MGGHCPKPYPIEQPPQLPLVKNPNSRKFPKGTFEVLNTGDFSQKYNISTWLGCGAYGQVNKCTLIDDPNVTRAVKQIRRTDAQINEDQFYHEMEMLKKSSHPNVLQVFEIFENETHIYIVTEYFEGQELLDRIVDRNKEQRFFDEHEVCHIMRGILEAVNYCHNNKICHRDIKPDNILINDKYEIKLIDFGFSQIISSTERNLTGHQGSETYMAPEVISDKPYNEKCDVWSIGHIFYILLAFKHPFNNNGQRLKGKYDRDYLKPRSKLAIDLLDRMFLVDPDKRISVKQALEHDWFKQNLCQEHQDVIDQSQKMMMIQNLRLMRDKSKLQRIVLSYISSQQTILTREEQQEVNIIFKQFDKDNDGFLGKQDVAQAFKETYPEESKSIKDEDILEIINKADTNGDGLIDIAEWHTIAISQRKKLSDSQLRWAFNFFDVDGCGTITFKHFKQALKIPEDQFDEIYWQNLITEVDQHNGGSINFDDFKKMMAQEAKIISECNIQ